MFFGDAQNGLKPSAQARIAGSKRPTGSSAQSADLFFQTSYFFEHGLAIFRSLDEFAAEFIEGAVYLTAFVAAQFGGELSVFVGHAGVNPLGV